MNSKKEWDGLAAQLAGRERPRQRSSAAEIIAGAFSILMLGSFLCAITGFVLMGINSVASSAWPSLDFLEPGIGFSQAYMLSALVWTLAFLRSVVSASLIISAQRGVKK